MTTAHRIVLGNNQTHVFASPPPWGPLGYPQIIFTATDPSHPGDARWALGLPSAVSACTRPGISSPSLRTEAPGHEVYGVMNFRCHIRGYSRHPGNAPLAMAT